MRLDIIYNLNKTFYMEGPYYMDDEAYFNNAYIG